MVWPFSSTPSQESSPSTPQTKIPESLQETSSPPTPSSQSLSRDETADKELASFLSEIQADLQPPQPKKYTRVARPPPSSSTQTSSSPSSSASASTDPSLPISEQLLPTSMSCRTAFDAAFYCNSFGGRFNDLYRYGTLRSCSESWNDFWFCMKTKSWAGEMKNEAIREHYRAKERSKYRGEAGASSEDIWRSRDVMVRSGTQFREPVVWDDEGEGGDRGWNERERERRQRDAGGVD